MRRRLPVLVWALGAPVIVLGVFARGARADECHEHRHAHPHAASDHHHHDHAHPHPGGKNHHHPIDESDRMEPRCRERPVIESFEPTSGPVGTEVRITGRFFRAGDVVKIGNREVRVTERLPNRVVVVVPEGATTGKFVLSGEFTVESATTFRVTDRASAPTITALVPDRGPPGTEIAIKGTNFSSRPTDVEVKMGGRPLTLRSASDNALRVIIPDGATTGALTVRIAGGGDVTSAMPFTIVAPLSITDFQPRRGGVGQEVTFTGTGLESDARGTKVSLMGKAMKVVAVTDNQIRAHIAEGSRSGRFLVERGGRRVETRESFSLTIPPVVTAVRPAKGPPGTQVTVVGRNFGAMPQDASVTVGGARMTIEGTPTATELTFRVPDGTPSGSVVVTVVGQGSATGSAPFEVLVPITVAGFEPLGAPIAGEVVIRGTGFSPELRKNRVTLVGKNCPVKAATATDLRIEVPRGAISGPFVVNVEGREPVTSTQGLQVLAPPVLRRMEPTKGFPDTEVVLTGQNLGTAAAQVSVSIGDVPCTVRSVAPDRVAISIPSGARAGPIAVTVQGQGTATTPQPFDVWVPLRVTSVAPSTAWADVEVTVVGQGFLSDRAAVTVKLGNKRAEVLRVADSELAFKVPLGAVTGPVIIDVRGRGTTQSPASLTIEAPLVVSQFSPRAGPPGSEVVIRGRGFDTGRNATKVKLGNRNCEVVSITPTELRVRIPEGVTSAAISVRVPRFGEAQTPAPFTVQGAIDPNAAMVASAVPNADSPAALPFRITTVRVAPTASGSRTVVLWGRGFGQDRTLVQAWFGSTELQVVHADDSCLFIEMPDGVDQGTVRVRLIGVGTLDSPAFRVVFPAAAPPAAAAPAATAAPAPGAPPAATAAPAQ